jgi:hypothetical protein
MADEQQQNGSPLRDDPANGGGAEADARSMSRSRSPDPAAAGNGAAGAADGDANAADAGAGGNADGMQTEEQQKAAEDRRAEARARREEQRRRQQELRAVSPSKMTVDDEVRTLFTAAVQSAVDRALLPTNVSWLNDYIRQRISGSEGGRWDCAKRTGGLFSALCRFFENEGLITTERRKESVVIV